MRFSDEAPWRAKAACRFTPMSVFFPPEPPDPTPDNPDPEYPAFDPGPALRFCAACPVTAECLAAHRDEPYGVFGGTTPPQRGFGRHKTTTTERKTS